MRIQPSFEKLKSKIEKAVMLLYRHDLFLITNTTNERSITHKLAEHIQTLFPEWNVDCEYNRRGENNTKNLPGQSSSYPDIIVHMRNTQTNLLVIETKSINSQDHKDIDDKIKIKKYMEDSRYFYQFGLWILFCKEIEQIQMDWFRNENGKCKKLIK